MPTVGTVLQTSRDKVGHASGTAYGSSKSCLMAQGELWPLTEQGTQGWPHKGLKTNKGGPGRARQTKEQSALVLRHGYTTPRAGSHATKQNCCPYLEQCTGAEVMIA